MTQIAIFDTTSFGCTVEYKDQYFNLSFDLHYIDESFDHEYGREQLGTTVVENIVIVGVVDEDNEPVKLSKKVSQSLIDNVFQEVLNEHYTDWHLNTNEEDY